MLFHTQMSFQLCIGQREHQPLIHTFRRKRVKAHADSNTVSRLKADTHHLTQTVRVISDDVHGMLSVLLVQLDRPVRRYTMWRQKGNHIACAAGGKIGVANLFELCFADARHGKQLFRLMIQHGQRVLPKHGINLFRGFRTDTLDLPGAQVSDDAFLAGYNHFIEALDFKLDAMLGAPAPTSAHIIAQIICRRQAITHRLDLRNHIPRRVHDLLTRSVQGDHVAGITGRNCFRVDQPFELTYQDRFSFPFEIG